MAVLVVVVVVKHGSGLGFKREELALAVKDMLVVVVEHHWRKSKVTTDHWAARAAVAVLVPLGLMVEMHLVQLVVLAEMVELEFPVLFLVLPHIMLAAAAVSVEQTPMTLGLPPMELAVWAAEETALFHLLPQTEQQILVAAAVVTVALVTVVLVVRES